MLDITLREFVLLKANKNNLILTHPYSYSEANKIKGFVMKSFPLQYTTGNPQLLQSASAIFLQETTA
jgi:hypothetical protein